MDYKVKFFLVLIFSMLLCSSSYAIDGEGCYIGGRIYSTNMTAKYGPLDVLHLFPRYTYSSSSSYPVIAGQAFCPPNDYSTYVSLGGNTSISCGYNSDSYNNATRGTVFQYNLIHCPLDNYVIIFLISFATIGYFMIKAK